MEVSRNWARFVFQNWQIHFSGPTWCHRRLQGAWWNPTLWKPREGRDEQWRQGRTWWQGPQQVNSHRCSSGNKNFFNPENKKEHIVDWVHQYYYYRRSPYRGGRSPPRRRSRSGGRGGRSRSRWTMTSWQTWSIVTFLSTQEPKEEPEEPVLQECEQGKGQEQVEEPTTQEEEQVTHHQFNS